jgi:hypothetical protein
MLLHHLSTMHRDRMRTTEDIAPVAAEAYEVVEADEAARKWSS